MNTAKKTVKKTASKKTAKTVDAKTDAKKTVSLCVVHSSGTVYTVPESKKGYYAVLSVNSSSNVMVNIVTKSEKTAKAVAKRCKDKGLSKAVAVKNNQVSTDLRSVEIVRVHEGTGTKEDRSWLKANRSIVRLEEAIIASSKEDKEALNASLNEALKSYKA